MCTTHTSTCLYMYTGCTIPYIQCTCISESRDDHVTITCPACSPICRFNGKDVIFRMNETVKHPICKVTIHTSTGVI